MEAKTVQSIVARQRWDVDAFYSPEGGAGLMYTRTAALVKVSLLSQCLLVKQDSVRSIA